MSSAPLYEANRLNPPSCGYAHRTTPMPRCKQLTQTSICRSLCVYPRRSPIPRLANGSCSTRPPLCMKDWSETSSDHRRWSRHRRTITPPPRVSGAAKLSQNNYNPDGLLPPLAGSPANRSDDGRHRRVPKCRSGAAGRGSGTGRLVPLHSSTGRHHPRSDQPTPQPWRSTRRN